ncbi:nucleoside hydrolase [Pleomorphomonas diazotrophica]|uniref:Nucleoside hydrolase n=1 Tax=Pleomorphomonas diazotrophica TaxID=1166257 RepID=A0A1I4QFP3_9HYPH|nr:nucleoside hydrolase [Pleomorphomonas diazotrophica]PKR90719.1 nucleoside hydrolase [Pleomorphomonas diazotrophica]SFM38460.1 Inosine-uridine nucleoside N-ribohydrolase [Pleomorphomonas diazotrophica]
MADTEKNLVIFDTDPGIDDAMALLFLKAQPSIKLAAVTTVFGNAEIDVTTRNALYLTQRFRIDVPVYAGASRPLTIARRSAPAFIHGEDGLGDAHVVDGFIAEPAGGHAADRMVEIVRANPGKVTILAVAPLTNLALALQRDPGIATLVKDVVIMGGAFGWGGRRGNATPAAEANVHNDPHAADMVFTAAWPVTAIGLDVTSHCVASHADAAELAESGEAGRFLWDISRGYEALYQRRNQVDGCCLHDVAAAAYLVAPELFTLRSGPVRVVTEGIAIGQTIQKPDGHSFGPNAWDGHPSKLVAAEADCAGVVESYKAAIRSLG